MIDSGLFTLDANISNSGGLNGGTITLGGTINSLGYSSGTLLTGVLTDFGFVPGSDGGDPLEFLFSVTGGDLASLYGGTGGIIMGFTGATGDFGSDFSSAPFNASADVAAVPVPAAVWLMFSALAGLASLRRR
ncbi:MAG: VPLPA-CTERM sorting domain-containing protein [Gammaproteobacteria bacterium]|nr:VPLPA-CTERM sorting domain-containing protein [Gammaproteobacteria bacterium]